MTFKAIGARAEKLDFFGTFLALFGTFLALFL